MAKSMVKLLLLDKQYYLGSTFFIDSWIFDAPKYDFAGIGTVSHGTHCRWFAHSTRHKRMDVPAAPPERADSRVLHTQQDG